MVAAAGHSARHARLPCRMDPLGLEQEKSLGARQRPVCVRHGQPARHGRPTMSRTFFLLVATSTPSSEALVFGRVGTGCLFQRPVIGSAVYVVKLGLGMSRSRVASRGQQACVLVMTAPG